MAVLKGTTAPLRSLAALTQQVSAVREKHTHAQTQGEDWTLCSSEIFDFLSSLLFLLDCRFVFLTLRLLFPPLFSFIDLHTHTYPQRHTLSNSARCGLTFSIYPESGGLIEIYNDYQMRLKECTPAA